MDLAAVMELYLMNLPVDKIRHIVGPEHVTTDPADLYSYGYDASKLKARPDCIAYPGSTREVSQLMQLANQYRFPVHPRGAGSGMVGAAVPERGGLVMALGRFNRVLEVDPDNMIAVVEPGVVTGAFQKRVAGCGLFYPPDPASLAFSTIGGNVAMGAGGPRAVKYGVTRDYVLGTEVVLATGQILQTGTRTVKGVVGYDLTRLLVGSEGTLGIMTRIILRLIPAPEATRTLTAVFPRLDDAAQTVCAILRARVTPATMEIMDQGAIRVVENYLAMGLPVEAEAILLMEVDGKESHLDEEIRKIREICSELGAATVEVAQTEEDRDRLWKARRSISPALGQIRSGKINEDVTVPRTQIPRLIRAIQGLAGAHDLTIVCFGHAGDGNIHTNIMVDRKDAQEMKRAETAVEELFRIVLDLGGTLSGEHGIGITKSPFLRWEIGDAGVDAMWRIKQALDPKNILNPGKMFIPNRAFFAPE